MNRDLPGGRPATNHSRRIVTLLAGLLACVALPVMIATAMAANRRRPRASEQVAQTVSPTPVPSCPTGAGSDTWDGGASGTWESSGSWSAGSPTSSSYVCIPGGDTVTVNSTDTVAGILVESGATVDVQSDGLTISGTSAPADSALQGSLQVASGASVAVGSSATLLNAAGGAITNQGTVAVAGDFEQDAGTVATGVGDNPVQLNDGSSMVFAGTGAGAFQVADGSAGTINVALSGDIAAGQSLEIQAPQSNGNRLTTVTAAGSFTNDGTITIDHPGAGGTTSSELVIPSGDTLTNLSDGTIDAIGTNAGGYATQWNENIDGDVDNQGTLNVGVAGDPYADLVLAPGSLLTNDGGTINTLSAADSSNSGASTLTVDATAEVDNTSGTFVNGGAVTVAGTFDQGAGSVATAAGDNPVQLQSGSSMDFAGTGPGAFVVTDPAATDMAESLSGNIAAGQSLEIQAPQDAFANHLDTVTASGSFTNAGTITLDYASMSTGGYEDSVELALPANDTLTNTGAIKVAGSPVGSYPTEWNQNIDGDIDNYGVLDVGLSGQPYADLVLAPGSTLTNDGGSVNVLSNAASSDSGSGTSTLTVSAATSGPGAEPAAAIDNSSGAINNHGAIVDSGGFTQDAGTVATGAGDNPVQLTGGSTLAFAGSGAGAFQFADSSGSATAETLTGNIAAGQSLEIQPPQAGGNDFDTVTASGSFINAGTIAFDYNQHPTGGGDESSAELALPANDTLTNTGTIDVTGSGIGSYAGQWDFEVSGDIDNQGTLAVGTTSAQAYFDLLAGSALINSGLVSVGSTSTIGATGGVTQSGGITDLATGAVVDASGVPSGLAMSGGVLTGAGRVTGNVGQTGGTLAPASASGGPGTLTISGNYGQSAAGTLAVPIDGTASGDYSVLAVGGNATLAGALSLQPSDAYRSAAATGDSDPVLTFGGTLTGNFAAAKVAPQNTALPQITGGTAAGDVLTCQPGSFSDSPTSLTYRWNRNGAAISGATSTTYTVKTADQGSTLSCTETAGGGAPLSGGHGFSAVPGPNVIDAVVGSTYNAGSTAATSAGTAIPVPATSTPAVTIPTTSVPNATDHEAYGSALTACGGTSPTCQVYSTAAGTLVDSSGTAVPAAQQFTFSRTSGSLPAGISLSSQGYLYGTPTQSGSFQFSVVATDPADDSSSAVSFTLTVGSAPVVTVSPASLPAAVGANAYGQSLTACGGTAPSCETYSPTAGAVLNSAGAPVPAAQQFTFAKASGNLPPGITLAANGYLSGTPTQTGSYQFSVTATDASTDQSAPASYTLTVNPGMSITAGSVHIGGALAAGAASVTAGSSGGINAVSIGGGSLTTLSGAGVPADADQVGLQIGHDQSGDCVTELEIGNAQGLVFNAANLDVNGCDSMPASGMSANTRGRVAHARGATTASASAAATASAAITSTLQSELGTVTIQPSVGAATDCAVAANGAFVAASGTGSCTVEGGASSYRVTVQGGTYTGELDGSSQSTAFQLMPLLDTSASIPPVMQVTPLTSLVDSLAGLPATGGTLSTAHESASQVVMSAYGFSSGTTAEQVIPSFAAEATGAQSQALSVLEALEAEAGSVTSTGSLVNALASEIQDGETGTVTEPLGSGTLPVTAGTSLFSTAPTPFEASYASSIPSLAPAGSTIKQALPVIPMPVTLPIVSVPIPVGQITPLGPGAFTETVTASSPSVSTAPFPTSGGASFTIEVVS